MSAVYSKEHRLTSLDALRGFDMIWILGLGEVFGALFILTEWSLWQPLATQFQHSEWHGLTFYDLIFPLFIFLSGVTLGISGKSLIDLPFSQRRPIYKKALSRVGWLCILGILYNHGWGRGMPTQLDEIRYASVLMRIGLAWFLCAMIVWHFSPRIQCVFAGGLLIGYWLLLCFVPTPEGHIGALSLDESWNSWIDAHWLPGITYRNMATDPEGILSHLPATVNALAGAFVGRSLTQQKVAPVVRLKWIIIASAAALVSGYLWGEIFPINKTLWTSSFVLVTCGWSGLLFALFYYFIDLLNWQRSGTFFAYIGANAILFYLLSSLFSWHYLRQSLFGNLIAIFEPSLQPLLSIFLLVLLQWLVAKYLYHNKLFLKV